MILKFIAGSLLALVLGIAVGIPVLMQNISLGESPKVYAEVVYAYFGLQSFSGNTSGLHGRQVISYIFILNVTNLSDRPVIVNSFDASAAEIMTFMITTETDGHYYATEPLNVVWNDTTQVRYMDDEGGGAHSSQNSITSRSESFPEGNEYYWSANSSQLIALTGVVEIPSMALQALRAGKIFLFSHVEGRLYENHQLISGAYVIKGVELEIIQGQEFLYNNLLKPNQSLHITYDGAGVAIVPES